MEYLRITNWSKHQDTAGKRCQFVKLSTEILMDPEFMCLDDRERLCFLLLLAYAGHNSNKIPSDPNLIMRLCYFDDEPNIERLIERGYLEEWNEAQHNEMIEKYTFKKINDRDRKRRSRDNDGGHTNVTPMSRHETETETETEKKTPLPIKMGEEDIRKAFEEDWQTLPRKAGKKAVAYRKYKNTVGKNLKTRRPVFQEKVKEFNYAMRDREMDKIPYGDTFINNWESIEFDEAPMSRASELDPRDDPLDPLYEPNRNGGSSDKRNAV